MRSLLNILRLPAHSSSIDMLCNAKDSENDGCTENKNKTVDSSFSVFKIEMMQFSLFTSFDISVIMNVS